jgi:hypothetical protein
MFAIAIISWLPYFMRILSELCTPSKLALSSLRMTILLPPVMMGKTSTVNSIQDHIYN